MADEHVKKKLIELEPYPSDQKIKSDDMIYVWNTDSAKLQKANVSQMPFGSGGGGGGVTTLVGSPFKVSLGDDQVTIEGSNTIISDVRLLGKKGYPISTTQLQNATFRKGEVAYNEIDGTVTILDFRLNAGEEVVLYPDGMQGSGGGGGNLQPIMDRLTEIESIVSVFKPTVSGTNNARVWWVGGLPLPAGWEEDADWRDYLPLAVAPVDSGKAFGSNSVTLKSNQQGSFGVKAVSDRSAGSSRNNTIWNLSFLSNGIWRMLTGGSGANVDIGPITVNLSDASTPIDIRPKSKGGMWIKYVGG